MARPGRGPRSGPDERLGRVAELALGAVRAVERERRELVSQRLILAVGTPPPRPPRLARRSRTRDRIAANPASGIGEGIILRPARDI